MSTVTLETARAAVQARKEAAGLTPGVFGRTDDYLGVLAGTDLEHDELEGWAQAQGEAVVPVMIAAGPVVAAASTWRDGLLIGIEYQRQRDAGLERRVRELRGALELVVRRAHDLSRQVDGQGAARLRVVAGIAETALES